VLVIAGIALDALVSVLRRGHGEVRRLPVHAAIALVVWIALVSPWLLWNLATFGTILQTSSVAHTFGQVTTRSLPEAIASLAGVPAGPLGWLVAIAALAVGVFLLRALWLDRALVATRAPRVLFAATYLALFVAAIIVYRWFRNWYFLAPSMALVVLTAVTLLPAEPAERRATSWVFAALWLFLAASAVPRFLTQLGPGDEGSRAVIAGDMRWITENLPADAIVGSFNSGRLGYFLPRMVVNLDGVVNNEEVAAFRTHTFDGYLAERGVAYVYDLPNYVHSFFDRYAATGRAGLTLVHRLERGDVYRFSLPEGAPR
jgi:hypothetical protein